MSQIEDRVETILDDKKTIKLRSGWFFRIVVGVLVLGVAGFLSYHTLRPRTYTATAWIQILSSRPYYIFAEGQAVHYENLVNTQFALIRSPLVVEKALENPEVANLDLVRKQRDKAAWLAKKLKLQTQGKSEMATISISTPDPQASEKIVNAVVDAFFQYYENQTQNWNAQLITQLTLELNRQQSAARLLQDDIRKNLEFAAKQGASDAPLGAAPGEAILKDIRLGETKLDTLRAELKMLREAGDRMSEIPPALLRVEIDGDPALVELEKSKKERQEHVETIKKFSDREDELKLLQDQIVYIDRQIDAKYAELAEAKRKEIQRSRASRTMQELFEKEQAVRAQEILLDNLRQRHREQMRLLGEQTVQIVDISFQQAQLERINQTLDLLSKRVVSLQTELNAPAQIQLKKKARVPENPD